MRISRPTSRGVSETTLDLLLTANLQSFSTGPARFHDPDLASDSDHAPVALTIN